MREKTNEQHVQKLFDNLNEPLPSDEQMDWSAAQVLRRIKSEYVQNPFATPDFQRSSGVGSRLWWFAVAAAVLLLLSAGSLLLLFFRNTSQVLPYAIAETFDGRLYRVAGAETQALGSGERIEASQTILASGGGAVLALTDGSRIEMRAESVLSFGQQSNGVLINLNSGGVIVTAAKQSRGQLHVTTKDYTVSVTGTVFGVNAEKAGSRVFVIEGEVRVQQGETTRNLLPGEQLSTNASLESISVKEEVAWSRNADEHIALLQLSALMGPRLSSEITATRVSGLLLQQQGRSIAGTIVRSDTSEPVVGAQITLSKVVVDPTEALFEIPPVATDPSGRFTISNIPEGRYRVRAAATSYATQEYGSLLSGGSGAQTGAIFDISASTNIPDLLIRLTPSATISGRILAATGETLLATEVVLLRYRYDAIGARILSTEAVGTTDDRGEYRLAGIGPGAYVLCARSPMPDLNREYATRMNIPGIPGGPVPLAKYQTTCYPSASGVDRALPLQVQAGADIRSRDFTLLRGNTYLVRGRIIDETTGQPPRAVGFSVLPKPAVALGRSVNSFGPMYKASDGTFELGTFSPGSYWIVVITATATGQSLLPGTLDRLTTRVPVEVVNADVENVQIVLRKPVPLRGTVKVEGQQTLERSDYNNLRVSLVAERDGPGPVGTRFRHNAITPDGSFHFENVLPDTYAVKFSGLPPDAFVKEARWGDADLLAGSLNLRGATDDTLHIVLSKRAGSVDGTLVGTNSLPAANREVVLIPNEARKRSDLYRTAVSDSQGRFAVRGLPPGNYKLFAWDQIEPFGYFDAEVLRAAEPRGVPVRIDEGARVSSEVRLIPASAGQ